MDLVIVLFVAFLAGAGVMYFFTRGPIPFFDDGAGIFPMGSKKALNSLVELLEGEGFRPGFTFHTDEVRRFIYRGFVINYTEPAVWDKLGKPSAAFTLIANSHRTKAENIVKGIVGAGFHAEIIDGKTVGTDEADLTFIKVDKNYLACGLIVIRKPALKMSGPKPVPYKK